MFIIYHDDDDEEEFDVSDTVRVYDFRNPNYLVTKDGVTSSAIPSSVYSNNCTHCSIRNDILVNNEDFASWKKGKLIQEAFPWLSPEHREILKTGIHPKCWDAIFLESD